jgi:tripartite ATP-independent transporter DctM subunit
MATAATMGSVALPEMKKYDYDEALATGSVAAGGTLGILIPPSVGFIVYGLVTEESVGKLFMAGIIPGIMLTVLFGVTILLQCLINPKLGPRGSKTSFIEKIISLKGIWGTAVLFAIVIGGIYSGVFTPTEAGGIGVVGALIIGLITTNFALKPILFSLLDTMKITAMITAILIGVHLLGNFITLTDMPSLLASAISSLNVSRYVVFVMILIVYLILGMLMNIIPMMMLTLPLIFPSILALGFDPIWFGVIMVIMMEMGQITPPVGINVFVISGVAKDQIPMSKIFKGIVPFIFVEILVIVILTIWPDIAMYLPNSLDVLSSLSK